MRYALTNTGYLSDSPDRFNDFNIIPSNRITMKGVNFPVLGIDNKGNSKIMLPGKDYKFKGSQVTEIPLRQRMQFAGQVRQDATRTTNQDDRFWGIQRGIDSQSMRENEFNSKYPKGRTLHQLRMDTDPAYKARLEWESRQRQEQGRESFVNMPATDLRRKDVMTPNQRGLAAGRTGEVGRSHADFHGDIMSMGAPIPIIQQAGKIPSLGKGLKNQINIFTKPFNKDQVYKNLLSGNMSKLDNILAGSVYNKSLSDQTMKGIDKITNKRFEVNKGLNIYHDRLKYNRNAKQRFHELYKDKLLKGEISKLQYDAISEHPSYFSFLDNKNLFESAISTPESLKNALNSEELIEDYWNLFKRSQRGITLSDPSKLDDAMIKGGSGRWGDGNYSSNSDLILDRFSTPRLNNDKGYQGQLELNLPDIENARGFEKLDLINKKFASSLNKNFNSKRQREDVIGLISEYGSGTAERVIKTNALNKQEDLLRAIEIKESGNKIDGQVLKKVGSFGLKDSEYTGRHFPYKTEIIQEPQSNLARAYNQKMSELSPDKKEKILNFENKIWDEYNAIQEKIQKERAKLPSAEKEDNLRKYYNQLDYLKRSFNTDMDAVKSGLKLGAAGIPVSSGLIYAYDQIGNIKKTRDNNLSYKEFLNQPENLLEKNKLDSIQNELKKLQSPYSRRDFRAIFNSDPEYKRLLKEVNNSSLSDRERLENTINLKKRQLDVLKNRSVHNKKTGSDYFSGDYKYKKGGEMKIKNKKGTKLDHGVIYQQGGENDKSENFGRTLLNAGSRALGAIGDTFSIPQRYIMQGLTGKYQDPSEAWGFENVENPQSFPTPFGYIADTNDLRNIANFGMDAVLDPMNVLGAGIAKSFLKGAKSGSVAMRGSRAASNNYPSLEKINQFYKNSYKSPVRTKKAEEVADNNLLQMRLRDANEYDIDRLNYEDFKIQDGLKDVYKSIRETPEDLLSSDLAVFKNKSYDEFAEGFAGVKKYTPKQVLMKTKWNKEATDINPLYGSEVGDAISRSLYEKMKASGISPYKKFYNNSEGLGKEINNAQTDYFDKVVNRRRLENRHTNILDETPSAIHPTTIKYNKYGGEYQQGGEWSPGMMFQPNTEFKTDFTPDPLNMMPMSDFEFNSNQRKIDLNRTPQINNMLRDSSQMVNPITRPLEKGIDVPERPSLFKMSPSPNMPGIKDDRPRASYDSGWGLRRAAIGTLALNAASNFTDNTDTQYENMMRKYGNSFEQYNPTAADRGDYTLNAGLGSNFRPDYQEGGEYDVSEAELEYLKSQGYDIELL